MDNCTLVNKQLWHEPLAWPGTWQPRLFGKFVCKKLLLYVSGIREQIEARKSADIFHRKYWVWCYPNLCNIRRCYPNILSVCPVHYGQGIPTGLSSSLVRASLVVTRSRWGHNTRVRCGPQIIYICEVISAQLFPRSDVALTQICWEPRDQDNTASLELQRLQWPLTAAWWALSQHNVWSSRTLCWPLNT